MNIFLLTITLLAVSISLYLIVNYRGKLGQLEATIQKLRHDGEALRQQLEDSQKQVDLEAHRARIVQNVYAPLAKVSQRIAEDLKAAYVDITALTQDRDKALELVISRTAALNHEKSISSRYRNSRDKLQNKLDKQKEATT